MRARSTAVEKKLARFWPVEADRSAARTALSRYGTEDHEVEVDRVHLAILKLCGGSLSDLESMTVAAKTDFRDVLMSAEYPEESTTPWALRPDLSDRERQALTEVRRRDRDQYEQWLNE